MLSQKRRKQNFKCQSANNKLLLSAKMFWMQEDGFVNVAPEDEKTEF